MDYTTLASDLVLEAATKGLAARNFTPVVVATKEEALAKIQEMIPAGASVMNGASTTLQEIGFIDYLKAGQHGWDNLHVAIVAEQDPDKQRALRHKSLASDFYLGSVHALTEQGELVIASNSGSQLPNLVFGSMNVVLVVGTQKIMPTLAEAETRLREYVVPLEDARMKSVGMGGTALNKLVHFFAEPAYTGRKITVILVKEKLGF